MAVRGICRRAVLTAFTSAALGAEALLPATADDLTVDVELVIAVDISFSMDPDQQRLQRDGYVQAFLDPAVIDAIRTGGAYGRIAVAYMEWAGEHSQRVTVDWVLIDDAESAAELAGVLAEEPIRRARRTSVSGAIDFAAGMFDGNGFAGLRRIIDISGDGANNQGRYVVDARDEAVARGITINGLPFVPHPDGPLSLFDMPDLDLYYADCVIGGPGAFSLPVYSAQEFAEAIRSKLILEIAGEVSPFIQVQARVPRVPCDYGERQWQRYFHR
jgi:hypothetical protein